MVRVMDWLQFCYGEWTQKQDVNYPVHNRYKSKSSIIPDSQSKVPGWIPDGIVGIFDDLGAT